MFSIAALAVVVGCGKTPAPVAPEIQPGPGPGPAAESPLRPLRGQYQLVDVDGEAVDSGTLSVEDGEAGLGIRYSGTLYGSSLERKILTPVEGTVFTTDAGRLHQEYEAEGHKITLDYETRGTSLLVEISECQPGVCLVTVLSAVANGPK